MPQLDVVGGRGGHDTFYRQCFSAASKGSYVRYKDRIFADFLATKTFQDSD